jgi:hypothetical protein
MVNVLAKLIKPTVNIQINKNVQNVMITPMNYPTAANGGPANG